MDQNQLFLSRELSCLLPDIFFHPIWIQFTRNIPNYSPDLIQNLVHDLQPEQTQGDLTSNCQIMFLCAFLYTRLGDHNGALQCIEQVLNLAETHGLEQISRCAAWGACAMCVRQGKYQEAVNWLSWLQDKLNEKDKWVLATLLELFKQILESQVSDSDDEMLDWFVRWGEWPLIVATDRQSLGGHRSRPVALPSAGMLANLAHQWGSFWHSIKHIARSKRLAQRSSGIPDLSTSPLQSRITPFSLHPPSAPKQPGTPALTVYCLGPFRVYHNDQIITTWQSGKGKTILKYMVANIGRPIPRDVLMDTFWREADPEAARRNLHQAIYSLRQTLKGGHPDYQHILFENERYSFNPDMIIWIDYQEFEKHVRAGRSLEASGWVAETMAEYGIAEALYQGDFLEEDLYEDWPESQREYFRNIYLDIVDHLVAYYIKRGEYAPAITLCQKTLAKDDCHEPAHRSLIQCYMAQGQRHLAIRQYHACVEALKNGLNLEPSGETRSLYHRITSAP